MSERPFEDASLVELIGVIASDVPDLLRKEVQLARAELSGAANDASVAAGTLGMASILALVAGGVLVAGLIWAAASLLTYWGVSPLLAGPVAALSVGALTALAAWLMFRRAGRLIEAAGSKLNRSVDNLTADAALMRGGHDDPGR